MSSAINFNQTLNFNLTITEMYPRIAWEPVVDPLGSAEHILLTSGLQRTSTHFLNKVSTFHLYFALAHRNSERKTLECTYMSISIMEGNSFCEYSVTVCKQHWVLWFVVCVTCAGLQLDGLLVLIVARIVLSQHIILDDVDVHSVFVRSNTRDGDYGGYGTGCTSEESCFCSWQRGKDFSILHILTPALGPISLLLIAYGG